MSVEIKDKLSSNVKLSKITKFGELLERTYPLLQIIFKNLLYEDLKSASQVNDVWGRYGIEEINRRNEASWISLSKCAKKGKLDKSNNFKYDSIAFGFIFYNHNLISLSEFICSRNPQTNSETMTFLEYLTNEIVPKDIDFWAFSCSSVYGPTFEKGYRCSFTGLFIPEIPNIKIKQIFTSKEADTFEQNISKDEHMHCALLFSFASHYDYCAQQFITKLLKRKDIEKTALGGGVISNGIKVFQENVSNPNTLFCVTFTQEKSVLADFDAYSIVISEDDDFKEELIKFKEQICLRKHSFALRICCAAKRHKTKESKIFNTIFPNIFLVGLDTDGEFGRNKFDSWQPEDTPDAKKQKLSYKFCHEYSSVIVILTWGKKMPSHN